MGGGMGGMRIGPTRVPVAVKQVMWVLAGIYLLEALLLRSGTDAVIKMCALQASSFFSGSVWQPFTYQLLHDDRNLFHLLGNLFLIWMFGSPVAEAVGRRSFLRLFILGGAAAGLLKMVFCLGFWTVGIDWGPLAWQSSSVGASGSVFVLLAWYCLRWPDRTISLLFVPLVFTARQALPLWFLLEWGTASGQTDHAIHLAGAVVGWWVIRRSGASSVPRPGGGFWHRMRAGLRRRAHLKDVSDPGEGPVFH